MRLRLGTVEHDLTTRTLVMGVVDRSSSFFGGDASLDDLLGRADQLVSAGADVLDVGGVKAGPGPPVGEEEELERVMAAVQALRARFDVPLSIDTWRARVVAEACAGGVAVVNDVSGFADPAFLPAAAAGGATLVVTSTRLSPGSTDVLADVRSFLGERVGRAHRAGMADDRIVVDAGLDVGKSAEQAVLLLRESAALADLGPPLLLDAAGTRFLGAVLGLDAEERRVAAHAASALAISRGARIVRAVDVRGATRVAAVLEALLGARLAQVTSGGEGDG